MEFEEVKSKVDDALHCFIEDERYLLENDACERTLVHRFAVCLERFFSEWDVDCEYNLEYIDQDEIIRKKSTHLSWRRKNGHFKELLTQEAVSIYPDIIVHCRGAGPNLLVIEVKKSSDEEEVEFDLMKLNAFRQDPSLHYEFALFIRFTNTPENGWIDTGLSKWVLVDGYNHLLFRV